MVIPDEKVQIIEAAKKKLLKFKNQYSSGLVTDGERYNKVVDIWSHANEKVAKAMMDALGKRRN